MLGDTPHTLDIRFSQKNRGNFLQGLSKTTKNRGKSWKTGILAKELAVFSARMADASELCTKMPQTRHSSCSFRAICAISEPAPNSQAHIADKTKKQLISELPLCSPVRLCPYVIQ